MGGALLEPDDVLSDRHCLFRCGWWEYRDWNLLLLSFACFGIFALGVYSLSKLQFLFILAGGNVFLLLRSDEGKHDRPSGVERYYFKLVCIFYAVNPLVLSVYCTFASASYLFF